jgi:hypothetical protein
MTKVLADFLRRCPVVITERDKNDWQAVTALQRERLVRLEWMGIRTARVRLTEAGEAMRKESA